MTFVPQSTNHILPQWRGNSFTKAMSWILCEKTHKADWKIYHSCFSFFFEKGDLWPATLVQWRFGGFLKWWYPTTIGFPTKKWSFWGVLGVPPFKETPIYPYQNQISCWIIWPLLCHSSCYRFCSSCSGGGGGTSILHSIVGTSVSNAVHTHTIHGNW